jgi:hypothetical protein
MDTTTITILIVGVVVLVVGGLIVLMLNRSWGDSLPTRIEIPRDYTTAARPTPAAPAESANVEQDYEDQENQDFLLADEREDHAPSSAEQPVEGLMLITHPLLLETIERSLDQGGPAREYVVQDGDNLYVSLDLIKDPNQRRMVADMIEKFQTQGHVGVWDMITMASTLGRRT